MFFGSAISWESSTFIKTTYDISLDSQISLLPLGFSLLASSPLVTVFDWDARENPEVTRNLSGVPRNTLSLMVGVPWTTGTHHEGER